MVPLSNEQKDAISRMSNGCLLCSSTGSGKSRTALAYYYICQGGDVNGEGKKACMSSPKDLYIITTAKKRDTLEWEAEMLPFKIGDTDIYSNKIVVDSWNNITKYKNVSTSFFIFDEQRVVSWGTWAKAFVDISKRNDWIMLSATPGDTWMDYLALFIAHGYFRNKTDFTQQHVIYDQYSKHPKIDRYLNIGRLIRLRDNILVDMDYTKRTVSHDEYVECDYDIREYKFLMKERWNIWKNEPMVNAAELCSCLRKSVNSNPSRVKACIDIFKKHNRVIIFYNFDYELDILKRAFAPFKDYCCHYDGEAARNGLDICDYSDECTAEHFCGDVEVAEWNGHKHQPIPDSRCWVYLVQYNAGAEGWNCIKTDTIIFYSQTYSYKTLIQAKGRIDRRNTPYNDLYYYHLKSKSRIDSAIGLALKRKKKFNESKFVAW